MAKSKKEIIKEIDNHIAGSGCSGSQYSDFYVGIANSPTDRLFEDHNVPEEDHCWIYQKANTHKVARAVEKHFLNKGMEGGGGGGDKNSDSVYVYQTSHETVE